MTQTVPGERLAPQFLSEALASCVGALILIVPLVGRNAFFLDPLLRRKRVTGERNARRDAEGFLRVTSLASLPDNGRPQIFTVYDDVVDAWNKFANQPVGRVFLRRLPDGSVTAFNVRCPHLGCAVDYRPVAERLFVSLSHERIRRSTGRRRMKFRRAAWILST